MRLGLTETLSKLINCPRSEGGSGCRESGRYNDVPYRMARRVVIVITQHRLLGLSYLVDLRTARELHRPQVPSG